MHALNPRELTVKILLEVLGKKHNLDFAFEKHLKRSQDIQQQVAEQPISAHMQDQGWHNKHQAWIKSICFGVLRNASSLDYLCRTFSKKSFSPKDLKLKLIIYIGLYQILYMDTKVHAAVFETVELTKKCHLRHASGFVNALLQHVGKAGKDLLLSIPPAEKYNHPPWLLAQIKQAYPQCWHDIIQANNTHPPFFLRVNLRKIKRPAYLEILHAAGTTAQPSQLSPGGIMLEKPHDVVSLPYFSEGYVSVQDLAAQQAAYLLELQDGQIVLDACAAPGGKTGHILETANVELYAIDQEAHRMERVIQNLDRLKLSAHSLVIDASCFDPGPILFDRILIDAPCSGTGVIRRHPDILCLRTEEDLAKFAAVQQKLLRHLWTYLKKGGILLYATCSILPAENDAVMNAFIDTLPDTCILPLQLEKGHATQYGWQFLPSPHGPDGFYYSKLKKI